MATSSKKHVLEQLSMLTRMEALITNTAMTVLLVQLLLLFLITGSS
jgi:hypothetical protein